MPEQTKAELVVLIADNVGELVSEFLSTTGRQYFANNIANRIADRIPLTYLKVLADVSDGFSPAELEDWRRILTELVDEAIDLPFIPDDYERVLIIQPLVDSLLKYAEQGVALISTGK